MVGDKLADIEAGDRAGCTPILVLTGYGKVAQLQPEIATVEKCRDLDCAATLILRQLAET
jgi:D-glycero-D-manno-heptose 1,7-bisphosphate phosphatase